MPPRFSKELNTRIITTPGLKRQPRTSPCENSCPAGNPIQKVHELIQKDQVNEALAYLKSRNPFPGVTGRICNHPCETSCNRNLYDDTVSIQALERYAADHADFSQVKLPIKRDPTHKKVAIIGSGPAGLTCAYFSALFGHEVTVFESASVLGGVMRLATADFRLPKEVVDREVGHILDLGVHSVLNTTIGVDVPLSRLREEFDACLIAVGAWNELPLDLQGGEFAQNGVAFLKDLTLGEVQQIGPAVAIVGGGGVAFDCALAARRLGASEIHVFCVEDDQNICAPRDDVEEARAEGIIIHGSTVVSKIIDKQGKPGAVEYFDISSFGFDESGQLTVKRSSENNHTLKAETVISAIGLKPELSFLQAEKLFQFTPKGALVVDNNTFATRLEGVFGAGDAVMGPSTIARSIGNGRKVALAIDRYLKGENSTVEYRQISVASEGQLVFETKKEITSHEVQLDEIMNVEFHEKSARHLAAKMLPEKAAQSFQEVSKGLTKKEAMADAIRCLHCGHCILCGCCVEDCPGFVLETTDDGPQVAHPDECWHCGCCRIACPTGSVYYEFPLNMMV